VARLSDYIGKASDVKLEGVEHSESRVIGTFRRDEVRGGGRELLKKRRLRGVAVAW